MSICEEAPASAFAGTGTLLSKFRPASLLAFIRGGLSTHRHRRIVANMRDFDDAQLADIGLTRSDIETALRMPSLDPSHYLIDARANPLKGVRRS